MRMTISTGTPSFYLFSNKRNSSCCDRETILMRFEFFVRVRQKRNSGSLAQIAENLTSQSTPFLPVFVKMLKHIEHFKSRLCSNFCGLATKQDEIVLAS